jgi:hypothetical protein
MKPANRTTHRLATLLALAAATACAGEDSAEAQAAPAAAAGMTSAAMADVDPTQLPNPFVVSDTTFGQASAGRAFGAASAIYPAPDGQSIWVGERCGANVCVDSDVDPIMRFDLEGNLMTSFGAGMFAWPHGMYVGDDGNVWVADATGYAAVPDGWGHVIYKFSPEGELLMTLGRRGEAGDAPGLLAKPSDLVVAPDGHIFVADGHDAGGNNRVVKLTAEGDFVLEWGTTGEADGQFRDVHAMAIDSRGRIWVGDRANSRIQLFDQEGNHLETITHMGRPSGIFIKDDVVYVADSESNTSRNPGVPRGVYIGNALTLELTAFVPDPEPDPDNSGTSGAEGVAIDANGNMYGAEVGPRTVRKYVRR